MKKHMSDAEKKKARREHRQRRMERRREESRAHHLKATTQEPKKAAAFKVTSTMVARAKAMMQKHYLERGKINPFALPSFPPDVLPGKDQQLAYDDDILANINWAGQIFENTFGDGLQFLGYPILSELAQRPEYRMVSERLATEMTRKWIKFKAVSKDEDKSDQITELDDAFKHFAIRDRFRALAETDGFMGRSHLFIELKGSRRNKEELKTPIGDGLSAASRAKIKKGSVQRFTTVEPLWTYPLNYNSNDPLDPGWYNPQQWQVMGQQIHASRLLRFVGREVPDLLKPAYAFGGLSMSQMIKPYVDKWLRIVNSVADVVDNFSTSGLKTDMEQQLSGALDAASGGDFFSRIELYNVIRKNSGLLTIDKDSEDFFQFNVPLGTLDALQAQAQEHIASVSHMPLIILLGITPTGLNASSEGELRAFYDWVNSFQWKFFGPNLQRIMHIVMLHLWGKVDPGIVFDFEPLWAMDEKSKADMQKTQADMDNGYVSGGILSPEEVRKRLAGDAESPYQGIDADDVPEPTDEEAAEMEGGEGEEGPGEPPTAKDKADERMMAIIFEGAEKYTQEEVRYGPSTSEDKCRVCVHYIERGGHCELVQDPISPTGWCEKFLVDQLATDDFKEDDHPRGQPGNSGQFAKGGGGSSKPTLDPSKMKRVGQQMGSNPGGVFEDHAGQRYYIKKGKSTEHVRNEYIAASLYKLAGAPLLKYRDAGPNHIATEMSKLDKKRIQDFNSNELKEAQKEFAVHAWLSNWDAVGLEGDNQGTVKGRPTSLDLGGALEFRAQGAPKGGAFGNKVGEFDTLRDKKINPISAKAFGGMSPAQIRESVHYVTSIPDNKIRDAVKSKGGSDALAEKLIARKNDLAQRIRGLGSEGDPKSPQGTIVVAAGDKMTVKELNGVKFSPWTPPKNWNSVDGQGDFEEPPFPETKKDQATGVIIQEPDGRTWVVQPRNGYGGYEATFPKGRVEKGLSPRANAIKEAFEESGLQVRLTGYAGDHEGDVTSSRYYYAQRVGGDPGQHDKETEGVVLAPKDKLGNFVNRNRDRKIIEGLGHDAAMDKTEFVESDHPRGNSKNAGQFAKSGGGARKVLNHPLLREKITGSQKTIEALHSAIASSNGSLKSSLISHLINNMLTVVDRLEDRGEYKKADKLIDEIDKLERSRSNERTSRAGELTNILPGKVAGDIIDYIEDEYPKYSQYLTKAEFATVATYSSDYYGTINSALRRNKLNPKQKAYVKTLNSALDRIKPVEGTVYRGAGLRLKSIKLYQPGKVIQEKAFTSTALSRSIARDFFDFEYQSVMFVIRSKTGREISSLSATGSHEREVLFKAGTKFKVESNDGETIVLREAH